LWAGRRAWLRWAGWRRRWKILAGLGIVAGLFALLVVALAWSLPLSRSLDPLPNPAIVLVSADGKPFARRGAYKEAPVTASALPAHVTQAFISVEDRRFYKHFGIDLQGIARATVTNVRARRVVQGGSTITQQLAKTSFLKPDRSLRRKAQEALIALSLELRLTKDEILSRYLSSIYFGDAVYGLSAASKHYFNKLPEKLTVGEAALLAGLVKAPSSLNPVDHPAAARRRARVVLAAMVDTGAITPAQARAGRTVRIRNTRATLPVGGYFADWVAPEVKDAFEARYGEVQVETTLDSRLQRRAERVIRRALTGPGAAQGVTQAALVAIRPDGSVVAMVGGADYRKSQFNRVAQARRQPGSAFKLFVYLAALRDGARPDMLVDDTPLTLADWSPKNFGGVYRGPITLKEAFAQSSNVAAVRVAQTAGRGEVIRAARDLGVTSPLTNDPALALGASETTLLELTSAYASVATGRAPLKATGIPGPVGPPLDASKLSPRDRARLLELLRAAVDEGTGRAARLPTAVYGKTGTTQDHRDAVFVGFAGDLIVGVWMGNDDRSPMKGVTGGGLPAQTWRDFMAGALRAGEITAPPLPPPPAPAPAPTRPSFGDVLKRIFGLR
jgi:penicillin-binding protein 1A